MAGESFAGARAALAAAEEEYIRLGEENVRIYTSRASLDEDMARRAEQGRKDVASAMAELESDIAEMRKAHAAGEREMAQRRKGAFASMQRSRDELSGLIEENESRRRVSDAILLPRCKLTACITGSAT